MDKLLTVSMSPHVHDRDNTSRLMYGVVIALLPAWAASVWFFGWEALYVPLLSVFFAVLFEYLIARYLLKRTPSVRDGSAVVTGLLLAFTLPVSIPLWMLAVGVLVAIGVGKMSFGGLGTNPFNPALVGRVFLFISFPVQMTSWPLPKGFATADAVTGATPLGILKEGLRQGEPLSRMADQMPPNLDMFMGHMPGSLGEVAAVALLLGFLYLLWKKIITWHIPVTIFVTVFLFSGLLWLIDPAHNATPWFHLLSGGLMLGAIFMATDYVTSPMTHRGMVWYGIGIGLLTVIIRRWGAYPEGVQFAILIMNAFVPLINLYVKPKRFGEVKKNG